MSEVQDSSIGRKSQEGEGAPVARGDAAIFASTAEERGSLPRVVWGVAALVVVVVVGVVILAGRKRPEATPVTLQAVDAYSASLPLTGFAMSEAANLSGGKLTYLDGHVQNTGDKTVTGATVQVVFQNDEGLAPQIDSVPLTLIRMKDPYIDTGPISTNPIKPGEDREFRLTFETVPDNWNTQMPEVRLIHTDLR
jgi:Protein of unknown function (DUF2393)